MANGLFARQRGRAFQATVLHAKDATGREIMRALMAALERTPNVSVFEDHFAIDLITSASWICPARIGAWARMC